MQLAETVEVREKITHNDRLTVLVQRVVKLLGAERCTLFLHHAASGDLVSKVRTGSGRIELRVPSSSGLVGACFQEAAIVNVTDAYTDPRFHRKLDERTGIRTRCVLCCPISNQTGGTIGVIEVINKNEGVFTAADIELLRLFSEQATVIVQNELTELSLEQAKSKERALAAELAHSHSTLQSAFHDLSMLQEQLGAVTGRLRAVRRLSWGIGLALVGMGLFIALR